MKAPHFDLLGVDGKRHGPASARGPNGLVVMFICNHCPYVKRSLDRILSDSRDLAAQGIGSIAVMPNDPGEYPEDSFDNMKRLAADKRFPFPYVIDESQDIARAYGVACTPEFYGYNNALELQYHGRIDELAAAMKQVALTGTAPKEQRPSVGCSIKWKKEPER
jgi:peroxiredoxin